MTTPLLAVLRDLIRAEGPIGLDRTMALALGHPEHGYYMRRDPLGAAGDFTTAPEISQMFGELIGLWCADRWQAMGKPDPVLLVELGPGRGTLAADAVRAVARAMPSFRAALRLHLVETSPVLRAAQAERLGDIAPSWHASVAELPPGPAIVVANELFDALPIRQWLRAEEGWHERRIGWDEACNRLVWTLSAEAGRPHHPADGPAGTIVEDSPSSVALAAAIARRLTTDGGAALIVDYGPLRSAPGDSFQAVRGHGFADPLEAPGEADLTAHVDFASLARAAAGQGAAVHGPVPQGLFLRALGLAARASALARARPERTRAIASEVERLAGADQMGTLFKAMAIQHPALPVPPGFAEAA